MVGKLDADEWRGGFIGSAWGIAGPSRSELLLMWIHRTPHAGVFGTKCARFVSNVMFCETTRFRFLRATERFRGCLPEVGEPRRAIERERRPAGAAQPARPSRRGPAGIASRYFSPPARSRRTFSHRLEGMTS
jgi:hypothetical protein